MRHCPEAIAGAAGVHKMIAYHLRYLPLSAVGTRYLVNIHVIRFTATPGRPCDTSPPGLHKDGEKYIATHLLGRCGAQGGEVIITDNDKHEMDRFTMREPGECYVFDDDRIWHMLTPVAVLDGNQYAYRDTLAFDMLPEGWEPPSDPESYRAGCSPCGLRFVNECNRDITTVPRRPLVPHRGPTVRVLRHVLSDHKVSALCHSSPSAIDVRMVSVFECLQLVG